MKGCMIEHIVFTCVTYNCRYDSYFAWVESSTKQSEMRLSRKLGAQTVFSFGGAGSKDHRIHLDAENI